LLKALTIPALLIAALAPRALTAQDLEPRAFSQAPIGLNIALMSLGYSKGNVLLDPSIPVEDLTARVWNVTGIYVRTLGLFGLSSKFAVIVPYAAGDWSALLEGQDTSTTRDGFGDPRVQLAINFIGAPAMTVREFAAFREGTIVGASLLVSVPLGQYYPDRLINLGTNRWAFRPRLGVSRAAGPWTIEVYGDVWFFTKNPEFFDGVTLEQDPLWALQGHVLYSFRPGLFLGVDVGYGNGGDTIVDGVPKNSPQKNTRLGAVLALPLARRHALKLVYVTGLSTRLGADFDTFQLSYQYRWGGGM
jgi:hypothetical protein